MKIIPVTAASILGVVCGPLFCGVSMTTNVVMFEETQMVTVVVVCTNGSFGGTVGSNAVPVLRRVVLSSKIYPRVHSGIA